MPSPLRYPYQAAGTSTHGNDWLVRFSPRHTELLTGSSHDDAVMCPLQGASYGLLRFLFLNRPVRHV